MLLKQTDARVILRFEPPHQTNYKNVTQEFFAQAAKFRVGEYVKDPAISYDNALLMPELGVERLDMTQYIAENLTTIRERLSQEPAAPCDS